MLKQMLLSLTLCAIAILAIDQPVYAQISEFKITASDPALEDLFGSSVSISGDYAVVGAWGRNKDTLNNIGSAYVFKRTGANWTEEFELLPSNGAIDDWFGISVFISGDYVVVGNRSGSAYVFKRTGTTWTEEDILLPTSGATAVFFGGSVSISGDYVVVGDWGGVDNGTESGSAYVFKRNGASWAQEDKLLPSDGAAYSFFGKSVSISGDYVIVGANGHADNGSESGSAYVFKRTGTSWAQEVKLLPTDGAAGDWFG